MARGTPPEHSGGQGPTGIQDRVFIVGPDGTKYRFYLTQIDVVVAVYENVAKADHPAEHGGAVGRHHLAAFEQIENLAIRAWLAEAPIGHDVQADIDRRLDADLKRVLDETALPQIGIERIRPRQAPKIRDATFDQRQLLRQQIGIGHAAPERR
jgi:hypothetical protein